MINKGWKFCLECCIYGALPHTWYLTFLLVHPSETPGFEETLSEARE